MVEHGAPLVKGKVSNGVRLLIVTQVVDIEHPILGFFHRWIEEFAKHCEKITVVCLRKGKHSLPKHVEVIALGEKARALRALELCSISFGRRNEYDAVFSHMSPEFVVASGWLWRLMGKEVGLWYMHKTISIWLRIAVLFVNHAFTASSESFRLPTSKLIITGHGIDTDFFKPDPSVRRGNNLLSVGRLNTSKRHDLVIKAAAKSGRELRVAGDGPEEANLKRLAESLGARVTFLGGLSQNVLRDEYRTAAHFIHTSETGSLDKVVLEAAACDCNIITTAAELYKDFPFHSVAATPAAIAEAIKTFTRDSSDRVSIVREKHSLTTTVKKILSAYER